MKYPSTIKSVKAAIRGILFTFKHEKNFRIEVISALLVLIFLVITKAEVWRWLVSMMMIVIIMTIELANTAIERVVDILKPQKHPYAKVVKDIAAGMVLVAVIGVGISGVIVLGPLVYRFF